MTAWSRAVVGQRGVNDVGGLVGRVPEKVTLSRGQVTTLLPWYYSRGGGVALVLASDWPD